MLSNEAWLKLLRGLKSATASGKLEWVEKDRKYAASGGPRPNLFELSEPKVYLAKEPSAMFEISSADGQGRAPFEFSMWKIVESRLESVGSVQSTTRISDVNSEKVNQELQMLFMVVSKATESGDDLVNRILGEINGKR